MSGIRSPESSVIPFNASHLKNLKTMRGKIDLSTLMLEYDVLYQTPTAEAMDAIVLQGEDLLLIQITTANTPDTSKIDKILAQMKKTSALHTEKKEFKNVKGWVVSLFDFEHKVKTHENLLITTGNQLVPILGEKLYEKLKEIKGSFS